MNLQLGKRYLVVSKNGMPTITYRAETIEDIQVLERMRRTLQVTISDITKKGKTMGKRPVAYLKSA